MSFQNEEILLQIASETKQEKEDIITIFLPSTSEKLCPFPEKFSTDTDYDSTELDYEDGGSLLGDIYDMELEVISLEETKYLSHFESIYDIDE